MCSFGNKMRLKKQVRKYGTTTTAVTAATASTYNNNYYNNGYYHSYHGYNAQCYINDDCICYKSKQ